MKKYKKTKLLWLVMIVTALIIGFVVSIFIFNQQKKNINKNVEITFLSPSQALVFWNTDTDSKGYVKFGVKKGNLDKKIDQTSSLASTLHVVVLDDIPIEGGFFSIHNDTDSKFIFSQEREIKFDQTKFIE